MKIAIGTTSELKVRALRDALERINIEAEMLPVKTSSGIADQPFGFEEIIKGATTRAENSLNEVGADIGVGVENGLVEIGGDYFDVACVIIKTKDGNKSAAFSPAILIPEWIIKKIKEENTEVGEITKALSGDTEKDGFKYFTNGAITRKEALFQAIVFAFAKILNKDKYLES